MDDDSPMNSYMENPVVASKGTIKEDDQEESGWTAYFEDFSNNNRDNQHQRSYCSSFISNTSDSLLSDAASCAAWKLSHHNTNNLVIHASSSPPPKNIFPNKLKSIKKSRSKEIYLDDSLEDTASSPVNSPKVGDLERIDMSSRKADDHIHMYSSLANKGIAGEEELEREEERNMNGKEKDDCTELTRRGLCLVPISILLNYLG